jgi:lipopolysaccharide biosynthesis regulator YciM
MARELDIERAVRVLVDAHFESDVAVARRYGITRQSISNYRRRLDPSHPEHSAELLHSFTGALERVRQSEEWDWLTDLLRTTAGAGVVLLERLKEVPADKLPDALAAMSDFLREAGVYEQTRRVIDAKLEAMKEGAALPQPVAGFRQPEARA